MKYSLRRVHIVAKSAYTFVMSVRLSAYISAAPTGRISVKFGIEEFHENLSRNYRVG
jgi:hypothetical protein